MSSGQDEKTIIVDGSKLEEKALSLAHRLGIKEFVGKAPAGGELLDLVDSPEKAGEKSLLVVEIRRGEDQEKVLEAARKGAKKILVETKDWRIIPLENLIAALQKSGAKLYARASSPEEAQLLAGVLEKGVSGIVVSTSSVENLVSMIESLTPTPKLSLTAAKVVRIELSGMGDRVCIDTTSLLRVGEGALVGNSSRFLFLVHSETIETEYVAARPFRVNAGGVHAYVLLPDGRTKYLSEISAGDQVLAVDWKGNTRRVVVGRAKIERRPMVLVEAEADGEKGTILLQYAETIRLVSPSGKPVSVSELKPGDSVLVHVSAAKARHFGMEVEEFIIEK